MNFAQSSAHPDWLALLHRLSGLIGLPFLLISIVIAVALTHISALESLSEILYPSNPIPEVRLDEPLRPGSWDQAVALAEKASHGGEVGYIGLRGNGRLMLVGMPRLSPEEAKHAHERQGELQFTYWIDPATMQITRAEGQNNSLVRQGHGVHALRVFGIEWLSIALVTSVSLIVLFITGALMAWRDKKAARIYTPSGRWHVRIGKLLGVLTVVIVVTTLQLELEFLPDNPGSFPIPELAPPQPLQPGSLDQGRQMAAQVMGTAPAGMYNQGKKGLKFTEAGDGIGGASVWVDPQTMAVTRITDWRNDIHTFNFVIHDGRWLGGMNAFNINDAAALGLLFLALSGVVLWWRGRREP